MFAKEMKNIQRTNTKHKQVRIFTAKKGALLENPLACLKINK